MNTLKKIILILLCMTNAAALFAQGNDVEMADTMRSNGRIYVVVAVVITILIGLILYMIRVDRKLSKLEKDNH